MDGGERDKSARVEAEDRREGVEGNGSAQQAGRARERGCKGCTGAAVGRERLSSNESEPRALPVSDLASPRLPAPFPAETGLAAPGS